MVLIVLKVWEIILQILWCIYLTVSVIWGGNGSDCLGLACKLLLQSCSLPGAALVLCSLPSPWESILLSLLKHLVTLETFLRHPMAFMKLSEPEGVVSVVYRFLLL